MTGKWKGFTNKIATILTANRLREFKVASNYCYYTYYLLFAICLYKAYLLATKIHTILFEHNLQFYVFFTVFRNIHGL